LSSVNTVLACTNLFSSVLYVHVSNLTQLLTFEPAIHMANQSAFAWDGVGDILADHSFVDLVSYAK
jgi:hypothetical protein